MMARLRTTPKAIVLIFLVALVALLQFQYDATKYTFPPSPGFAGSPEITRVLDFGFHPAAASFLWVTTMPEVLDLFARRTEFYSDLAFLNAVDPKMTYPYAFAVLTLPAVPAAADPTAVDQSFVIGERGLQQADPDWRIPYYMATNYFLLKKDKKDALWYYDIAARTPGIPQFAERFSLNFGIGANERQTTINLWETIRDTTNDQFTKDRAQAYIDRLNDFDYIEVASRAYKKKFGRYPTSTDELVQKGIIDALPVDPFGFTFIINPDGTAGINLNILPSYITSEPAQ